MKMRTGFVSNSSSSSFIVIGNFNIPDNISRYFKLLNDNHLVKILDGLNLESQWYENDPKIKREIIGSELLGKGDDIYLTKFICDSCENVFEYLDEIRSTSNVISYRDGSHNGPYDDGDYIHIGEEFYIAKKVED